MTMFSRKTLVTTLAAASLSLAGAALTSAPAAAKGWHGGHHGGGHHGHHGHGGHWGGHGGWGYGGGVVFTGYYGGDDCFVVRRKVFAPGFGFAVKRRTVCE